ncbi:gustatory and odorant receptor 22-like [Centruroides vittatus]|uniref:gustatory and odorant receptor 22-like n=1 Tax=Centruroides vittatus TaxID=120091 RepID=UPI00350EC73B
MSIDIFSFYYFHGTKQTILSKINSINEIIQAETSEGHNKLLILKCCLIWITSLAWFLAIHFSITKARYKENDINKLVSRHLFHYEDEECLLLHLTFFCFVFFIVIGNNFLLLFFSSVCKEIESVFKLISKSLLIEDRLSQTIAEAQVKYKKLTCIVNDLNDIYSSILLFWTVFVSGNVIFQIGYILNIDKSDLTIFDILVVVFNAGVKFLLFSVVCCSSSYVTKVANDVVNDIYEISLKSDDKWIEEKTFRFSVISLQNLPKFSGYNMINVNTSLLLTIVSVIVTYTVLLIQFSVNLAS